MLKVTPLATVTVTINPKARRIAHRCAMRVLRPGPYKGSLVCEFSEDTFQTLRAQGHLA